MSAQPVASHRKPRSKNRDVGTGWAGAPLSQSGSGIFCLVFESGSTLPACGVALVALGTGGALNVSTSTCALPLPTGASGVFAFAREEPETRPVKSASELASEVRAAFGFSMSQLASVLQVKRQTIYLWLDSEEPPRLQSRNLQRLIAIHAFAQEWSQLCTRPTGKWLNHAVAGRGSLIDLFSRGFLDRDTIRSTMQAVAARANEETSLRKRISIAERLRHKGFSPPPEEPTGSTLARYSGTVSSSED